jgi:uncharacterized protein
MPLPLSCACALACALTLLGCEQSRASAKYERTNAGAVIVLRQGDEAFSHLKAFMQTEELAGATFTGLGFGHATFGYFNRDTKSYDSKELRDVELASLTGSIAWQDGAPSIHAHAVATDRSFAAFGGHLLRFEVGTGSLELHVVDTKVRLERRRDEKLGANILGFGE